MTFLPHPDWRVKGVKQKEAVTVGPRCAAPGCGRWADHAHHIWRRSFLAGDYNWVCFEDDPDTLICNLTGLCFACHKLVTENEVRIEFDRQGDWFLWVNGDLRVPLEPQPPLRRLGAAADAVDDSAAQPSGSTETVCPTCGKRKKPKEELPVGEKRPKKTWSLAVPVDHRENGYEIIESLLLSAAEKLDRADHKSYKYYTLVDVLAFFEQTFLKEAA